jgi:IS30 family transposase
VPPKPAAKGKPVKSNKGKPKKAPSDDSSLSSVSSTHEVPPKPAAKGNPVKSIKGKNGVPPDVQSQCDGHVSKPPIEGTTPTRMKEKLVSLEHYKNFVKKAYNVHVPEDFFDKLTIDSMVLDAVSNRITSKTLTPKQLQTRIHIIKNWETGADGIDVKKFRKKNKIGYRLLKSQHSVKANQDGKDFLYNVKNQVYVDVLQVFDLIAECHSQVGCLKTASTKNAVDSKYANISREEVQAFVQTCKYCSHDQVAKKRVSGAIKPIISHNFRERFQVDLIDYREDEQVDVYGNKMRWLLVLKDHLTRLCYLKPLPNKKSKYVAHELYHIFGLIGHPLVLQSDNGKEFTGSALLDMLYELDPAITTVYGRPRTPRDQGSVERLNQTIKRIISKQVMKMKDAFPH